MTYNAHDAYLESRVLSAAPLELVRLLYQTATGAVREARRHLEAGKIVERSRAISKAGQVLLELSASLDFKNGGEIAPRLFQLYDYMLRRLTEANFKQADAPLAEVLGLLATLSEAWDGIQEQPKPAAETHQPWAQPPLPTDGAECSTHSWNL